MKKQWFDVTGMTCSACSAHVEKSVAKVEGVAAVQVNLLGNSMTVQYDPQKVDDGRIIAAVQQAGYGASVHGAKSEQPREDPMAAEIAGMKQRLIVSFAFLIPLFYISMGHMMGLPLPGFFHGSENALTFAFTQLLLCLPIVFVNRKYYTVGFKTLLRGAPNMDSLIAMGSTAALVYGVFAIYRIGWGLGHGDWAVVEQYSMDLYFESAAMILTLITLGKYLETRSKGRTSEAISKLLHLAPKTATVLRGETEVELPVEQVAVGDIVLIRPGQSVPVDGVVIEGSSSVDEAAITGESIPVEKRVDDKVITATINKSGFLKCRALQVGDDTTLAQIIRLVEEAGASKAPIAKLADKVSGIFVPVVIGLALLATAVWLLLGYPFEFALSIGIAVLVISCPCALGLATPVAIMVGTGKGAEQGILIKSAESLETAHTINTVVLDKTGTITEGRPRVTDLLPAQGIGRQQLLALAASMEKPSEHPLSEAIVEQAAREGLALMAVRDFSAVPGRGILATVEGKRYFAGNRQMMEENGVADPALLLQGDALSEDGKTPLYFADEAQMLGIIAVADVVKPTSREAIANLQRMGIEVVMLTGDNKRTAAAIQRQMGLSRVIAEVLPQEKEKEVAALQAAGRKVAMVGDGINDAPALTRADVGIAIGAGTDVAIESADIVLMKSDLLDVVTAIQLSKAVIRNIKENLFWAFFYNSVGIPLAAGVFFSLLNWRLNPMFAAAAMSLSSVCVVSNALRLKLFRPSFRRSGAQEEPAAAVQPAPSVAPAPQAPTPIETQSTTKEETVMKKEMKIEGMSCSHCSGRVEKALCALPGVQATVNLEAKTAYITLAEPVEDAVLTKAVTDAGYEVVSIA